MARSSAGPGVKVADRERNQKNKGSIDRALTLPVVRVEPRHGPDLLRISELVAVRPARDQVEADRQMHVGFGLSGAFPCGQRQSRFSGGESHIAIDLWKGGPVPLEPRRARVTESGNLPCSHAGQSHVQRAAGGVPGVLQGHEARIEQQHTGHF